MIYERDEKGKKGKKKSIKSILSLLIFLSTLALESRETRLFSKTIKVSHDSIQFNSIQFFSEPRIN